MSLTCGPSLCVKVQQILNIFYPLFVVLKHLKLLYQLNMRPGWLLQYTFIHPSIPEEASVLMHQDMQLCGLLLHAHGCTNSPNTHGVKQQVWPLESGVISYAFTLYFHSSAQAPSVCLLQTALSPFLCVCTCTFERERDGESSVRQLYLHLYEQIPVGRAAEEHTSCLTYILYQAVFVCTVP